MKMTMQPPVPTYPITHGALLFNHQSHNSQEIQDRTNIGMKTQPIIVTTQKELIETTLKFLYSSISAVFPTDRSQRTLNS